MLEGLNFHTQVFMFLFTIYCTNNIEAAIKYSKGTSLILQALLKFDLVLILYCVERQTEELSTNFIVSLVALKPQIIIRNSLIVLCVIQFFS